MILGNMRTNILILLLWIVAVLSISIEVSFAQEPHLPDESVKVYFRQGSVRIDDNFGDNSSSLQRFIEVARKIERDSTLHKVGLRIVAAASPEGLDRVNRRIVKQRANAIVEWIDSNISTPIEYTIDFAHIDWDGLIALVEQSNQVPYKDEVLELLRTTPEYAESPKGVVSLRLQRLMELRHGRPYLWLLDNIFPQLRYADAQIDILLITLPTISATSSATDILHAKGLYDVAMSQATPIAMLRGDAEPDGVADSTESNIPSDKSADSRSLPPLYFALKTNVLYLLALTPNIGAELCIGGQWSIAANWQYAWWSSESVDWYHRLYGGDLSLRRWFGKRAKQSPLSGHHVGVYAQMMTYDFLFGKNRIGELAERWGYAVGVEYGYSLPIGESLSIDFSLGVGYLSNEYKRYERQDDCYVWIDTRHRDYFGPTKAEVSLVWRFGGKKGGRK